LAKEKLSRAEVLEKFDPDFEEDLEKSKEAMLLVMAWLSFEGQTVVAPPVQCRPDIKSRAAFADKGDLFVLKGLEVKRRKLMFTSAEDFPYPTVFIDVAKNFDAKVPKPYLYLILSDDMTHAIEVDVKHTRDKWTTTIKFDRGRKRNFYECPVEHCKFKPVPEEIRKQWKAYTKLGT
jgi:hypothetical protein